MFSSKKVKCLNHQNKIKFLSTGLMSSAKRFDITKQLQQLKAYKLCYDQLGYIPNGTMVVKGREVISNTIHGRINKTVKPRVVLNRKRVNPRERVLIYVNSKGTKWTTLDKYHDQAILLYRQTGELYIDKAIYSDKDFYIAEMLRCMRLGLLSTEKVVTKLY